LPDLTVSADPVFACEIGQPRAQISVSLCNRGLLEVAPGFDIAVLADRSGDVAECTEGENNRALITNVFCNHVLTR